MPRASASAVAAACLAAIATGGALQLAGHTSAADGLWAAAVALLLIPLGWSVGSSLLRGDVGVDAIALVSMAGALALGQYLAGAVIALVAVAAATWATVRATTVAVREAQQDSLHTDARVYDELVGYAATHRDFSRAGDLVRAASEVLGGRGGGKDDIAQGGGVDGSRTGDALSAVEQAISHHLRS